MAEGRLKFLTVLSYIRQGVEFKMVNMEYEVLVISAHEDMVWVQLQRKLVDGDFLPVRLKHYHTVLAASLRDVAFPAVESPIDSPA